MNPTDLNEMVKTKKSEEIKGFLSKVIHTQTATMFLECNLHVMIHTLCKVDKPLPHDLAIQNMYTEMTTGSKSIVVVMQSLTSTPLC